MIKSIPALFVFLFLIAFKSYAQPCSLPGMTPGNAIPVCGTSVFHQSIVTNCTGNDVAQTSCAV